jgi:hypothetical protein
VVETAAAISAATEQQTAATQEIACTVHVVTDSTVAATANTGEMTHAASHSDQAAGRVAAIPGALLEQASQLGETVTGFLFKAREVVNVSAPQREAQRA